MHPTHSIRFPLTLRACTGTVARMDTHDAAITQIIAHHHDIVRDPTPTGVAMPPTGLIVYDGHGRALAWDTMDASFQLTWSGIHQHQQDMARIHHARFPCKNRRKRRDRHGLRGTPTPMRDQGPDRRTIRADMDGLTEHHLHRLFPKTADQDHRDYDDGPLYIARTRNWKAYRSTQYHPVPLTTPANRRG